MNFYEYEYECLVKMRVAFNWDSERWRTPREQAEALIENYVIEEAEILECKPIKQPPRYDEGEKEHYGE